MLTSRLGTTYVTSRILIDKTFFPRKKYSKYIIWICYFIKFSKIYQADHPIIKSFALKIDQIQLLCSST